MLISSACSRSVAGLALGTMLLATGCAGLGGDAEPSSTATVTETATVTATPTATATVTAEPEDGDQRDVAEEIEEEATTSSRSGTVKLELSDAVNDPWDWEEYNPRIAGESYMSGMMSYVSEEQYQDSMEFLVESGAERFTAVAGQEDRAGNTGLELRFEVIDVLSGDVLDEVDLSYGEDHEFEVNVSDVSRIELRTTLTTFETEPGWSTEREGRVAWADLAYVTE